MIGEKLFFWEKKVTGKEENTGNHFQKFPEPKERNKWRTADDFGNRNTFESSNEPRLYVVSIKTLIKTPMCLKVGGRYV